LRKTLETHEQQIELLKQRVAELESEKQEPQEQQEEEKVEEDED